MPADDGLHGLPAEDLAAFLRGLRALRVREGLSLDGLAARADTPPDTLAAAQPARPGPAGGRPGPTVGDLGPRRRRWRPSPALTGAVASAVALAALAAGGALLTSRPGGHGVAGAPGRGSGRSVTAGGARLRMQVMTPGAARFGSGLGQAGTRRAPGPRRAAQGVMFPAAAGTRLEVAGVGCPDRQGDGFSLDAASTGPGWTAAAGGWAGNGCDGRSVWTMDPHGSQSSPSTLTWFFHPGPRAAACRLAVFLPARNALGVASYEITSAAARLGSVPVDQAASAGRWVSLGSYRVTGGLLDIRLVPGTVTLTAASTGKRGKGGNGNSGNSGNGNSGNGGNGDSAAGGDGGTGHGGPASGPATPSPGPVAGHNGAVAASAASASCG